MDTATVQALAALLAVWLAAIGLLVGFVYWHYRLQREDIRHGLAEQRGEMQRGLAEQREDIRHGLAEQRGEMQRSLAEQREDIRHGLAEQRGEMQRSLAEQREDIRRSHEEQRSDMRRSHVELLAALNGHTHDTNTGAAVFHEVPTAAND